MKRLIFVNGTMGVGKSAVCQVLKGLLAPCAYLDGDRCWDLTPFRVTEERKRLVLSNIVSLMRSYCALSDVENVLFSWVMPSRSIVQEVYEQIGKGVPMFLFTLMAEEATLRDRLAGDVAAGRRSPDILERAIGYLPAFEADMGGTKIVTDARPMSEIARSIADMVAANAAKEFA